MEAPNILGKLPIILVYIFGRGLLGFKNIISVKPNGNSPIYIFDCQQMDFDNLLQKVIWNLLNNLEGQE